MYDANVSMEREGKIDEIVTRVPNKKNWEGCLKLFSLESNKLMWNRQRVPTADEVEEAVWPVHLKENGKH